MEIFISKTGNLLNGRPYLPDLITPRICLNPMYPNVKIFNPCYILLDSAAYQNEEERLTFEQAYQRQVEFQNKLGQKATFIVAYDKIENFEITMDANLFLLKTKLPPKQQKILVVQGKTNEEYSECLRELINLNSNNNFIIGFGGIAKSGINKKLEKKVYESIENNKKEIKDINKIHIFGCFTNRVLKNIELLLHPETNISVDTASCEIRSVMGNVFLQGKWIKKYNKSQKYKEYHPNKLAHDNISRVINYYENYPYFRYQNLLMGI